MQLLLNGLHHVLVAMFIVGGIGSILVIAVTFVEGVRALFSKGE